MRRILYLLVAAVSLLALSPPVEAQVTAPRLDVIQVKGTINPVLTDYIGNAIRQAESRGSMAVILQLDTPGGLDTAMRDIVQVMVNSRVPVVVYVSPSGARAASAGVFITMAAHIAAMAPNTAIGAAHPVALGGQEGGMPEAMEEKVVNDAAAYIRSLAQAQGRNMEWAEKAVRESVSATETEALELNVIDLIAPDLDSLVARLNGMSVTMLDGRIITLHTEGAALSFVPMSAVEKFLYTIADPNIAYILLSLAMLGIIAEIFNPGLIFPGVVGAISLLLAFFALGVLPVNMAGVLLIILAFGLFIAEILTTSFGLFTMGGAAALVIGSLILFRGAHPVFQVDPWLIATVTIIVTVLFAFVITRAIMAQRRRATTGREELAGKTAVVREALDPEGTVFYKGELWKGISDGDRVEPGEEVVIQRIDGLRLYVTRKQGG